MILAAGRGTRMRHLTANTPKPLLKIADKTLIEWQIFRLARAGISEIVVNLHYLGEQIADYLGDGKKYGVQILYSLEEELLETAGGIKKALPLLGQKPFLVVNADVWIDIDIADFLRNFHQEYSAYLLLVKNPAWKAAGDFAYSDGYVLAGQNFTFAGMSVLSAQIFQDLEEGIPAKLAPIFHSLAEKKMLYGEIFNGDWQDVGTPERLEELQGRFCNGVS